MSNNEFGTILSEYVKSDATIQEIYKSAISNAPPETSRDMKLQRAEIRLDLAIRTIKQILRMLS
jgi:hypothetical protein